MKINPLQDAALTGAVGATRADRVGTSGSPTAPGLAPTGAGVPVTVSSAVRALDTGAGSGIDEVKVAAMRAAIADGSFKVDSGAIADKLLANAQEFLSRARG
ncbi:MAG: flagellar biosynthesis anti-sigma factor FlgM [Comamonadaceae bacterium]|nr:MAG: flagellar biosynthesis anti-sigma factor FlgM [Comamonadaceae bacterium]